MAGPNDFGFVEEEEVTQPEDLGFVADETVATTNPPPVAEVAQVNTIPQEKPDSTSTGEALGRALRSGASLFQSDEASGAMQALYGGAERAVDRLGEGQIYVNPIEEAKRYIDEYKRNRNFEREDDSVAAAEHPIKTGIARVGGALLNPLTYLAGPGMGALSGGLGGAGASDGDLEDTLKAGAAGVALGGAFGKGAQVAPVSTRIAGAGLGLGTAALSDGEEADRVSAGLGGLMALPGLADNFANWRARKVGAVGQKARGQLTDEIKAGDYNEDYADGKAMNKLIDGVSDADNARRKEAIDAVRLKEKESLKALQGNKNVKTAEGIKEQLDLMSKEDQAKSVISAARQKESAAISAAKLQEQEAKRAARIKVLQEQIKAHKKADLANETIAKVRQAEMAELQVLKQQQAQAKIEKQRQALNNKETELRARQARKAQEAELKAYKDEETGVNKKLQDYIKTQTQSTKARAKIRSDRTRARKALEKAIADAEAESQSIDASAQGVYAQAFQNLANRSRTARDIYQEEGVPVPQEVVDATKYTNKSYMQNTKDKLVYPEQAEANYRAQLEANNKLKTLAARKALEEFDAKPFDEEAEVAKLINPVPNEDFYKYAQSLGLNVGRLEEFNPRNPYPLNKAAPKVDEPVMDTEETGLAKIEAQRQALLNPEEAPQTNTRTDEDILTQAGLEPVSGVDKVAQLEAKIQQLQTPQQKQAFSRKTDEEILTEAGIEIPPDARTRKRMALERRLALLENPEQAVNPYFKPEAEILKEAGLDNLPSPTSRVSFIAQADNRTPVDARVQSQIDNARPAALDKVKVGSAIGAGVPMGIGGVASMAGGGIAGKVGAVGAGVLAGAGSYVGARRAIQKLSAVDANGKYKNPADVAAVMDSIQAALTKYPNLRQKYLKPLTDGVTRTQLMYFIHSDKDLAAALDEQEGMNQDAR